MENVSVAGMIVLGGIIIAPFISIALLLLGLYTTIWAVLFTGIYFVLLYLYIKMAKMYWALQILFQGIFGNLLNLDVDEMTGKTIQLELWVDDEGTLHPVSAKLKEDNMGANYV